MLASVGGPPQSTGTVHIGNHGFSGWQTASFTFTPTSSSEVLSFMSIGTAVEALPPFALLVSVSAREVPEPSTWVMMLRGCGGLGVARLSSNHAEGEASRAIT
jgi:hypothetical protein